MILLLAALVASPDYFVLGNDEYEAGRFDRALVMYDSAVAARPSAEAYYNRGNARFRLGEVGRAIADYQRAWVLKPHDRQVRHNLEFSRRYRPDKTLALENPIVRAATEFLRLSDAFFARLLAGALFLLAMAALALLLLRGQRFSLWLAVGFGALFFYFLFSALSWAAATGADRAVVVVPELTLRAGPGPEYKDIVVVHDGLEVSIRERRPEWVLVQVPGGEGGWAEAASVEPVFPR